MSLLMLVRMYPSEGLRLTGCRLRRSSEIILLLDMLDHDTDDTQVVVAS